MEEQVFYKPECKLIGEDGNVFNIIGRVSKTLKEFGYKDKADEFKQKVKTECKSYDEVLRLVMDYVEIVQGERFKPLFLNAIRG